MGTIEAFGLKKCPFCGSTLLTSRSRRRRISYGYYYTTCYIVCKLCSARGPVASTAYYSEIDLEEKAVELWDKRELTQY